MNFTTDRDADEEIFNRDVSDEALEGMAATESAVRYTLQFCTSVDCALLP